MIADLVISGVADFLKASGKAELSAVTVYERDFGGDLTYPAIIVADDGTPDENEIIRGQWTVPVAVILRTAPEGDENAATHRDITKAINDLIGDSDLLVGALGQSMQCNDSLGGQGTTEASDGFRETTFTVEIKAAETS
tara:strand:- start:313 stop:729 length:417 start_codon:yes stop_codon:yes gene_type:complete